MTSIRKIKQRLQGYYDAKIRKSSPLTNFIAKNPHANSEQDIIEKIQSWIDAAFDEEAKSREYDWGRLNENLRQYLNEILDSAKAQIKQEIKQNKTLFDVAEISNDEIKANIHNLVNALMNEAERVTVQSLPEDSKADIESRRSQQVDLDHKQHANINEPQYRIINDGIQPNINHANIDNLQSLKSTPFQHRVESESNSQKYNINHANIDNLQSSPSFKTQLEHIPFQHRVEAARNLLNIVGTQSQEYVDYASGLSFANTVKKYGVGATAKEALLNIAFSAIGMSEYGRRAGAKALAREHFVREQMMASGGKLNRKQAMANYEAISKIKGQIGEIQQKLDDPFSLLTDEQRQSMAFERERLIERMMMMDTRIMGDAAVKAPIGKNAASSMMRGVNVPTLNGFAHNASANEETLNEQIALQEQQTEELSHQTSLLKQILEELRKKDSDAKKNAAEESTPASGSLWDTISSAIGMAGAAKGLLKIPGVIRRGGAAIAGVMSRAGRSLTGALSKVGGAIGGGRFLTMTNEALAKVAATPTAATIAQRAGQAAFIAGKALPFVAAGTDIVMGAKDLLDGKEQSEMPSGWDVLSPFKWGAWIGHNVNKGIEYLSGGQSLGSMIYDAIHGEPGIVTSSATATPMLKIAEAPKRDASLRLMRQIDNQIMNQQATSAAQHRSGNGTTTIINNNQTVVPPTPIQDKLYRNSLGALESYLH